MSLGQLLILHLMAGIGVAGAVSLAMRHRSGSSRWFQILTAMVFWPMYLPLLLQPQPKSKNKPTPPPMDDDLEQSIAQIDAELETALKKSESRFGDALSKENARLHDLLGAWTLQAEQIREMDQLLNRPECAASMAIVADGEGGGRLQSCLEAIKANVDRLRQTRQEQFADLLGALAEVRELVSMIHLATYGCEPATRAEEWKRRIAASVETLAARTPPTVDCRR